MAVKQEKYFIIDTNVLLDDPQAIMKFADNRVVIPIMVLEEIDKFKKGFDEKSRNARELGRIIDSLDDPCPLHQGCRINDQGGTLKIQIMNQQISDIFNEITINKNENVMDNMILAVTLYITNTLRSEGHKNDVILITKDHNMRIRARALGLISQDFNAGKIKIEEIYSGIHYVELAQDIDALYKMKVLDIGTFLGELSDQSVFYPNEFVVINKESHRSALTQVSGDGKFIHLLSDSDFYHLAAMGIRAKNKEQNFALKLLLDDRVQLVSLIGSAGTGKTLLAIAAGLRKVLDEGKYKNLLVARPIIPMGKDLGYLPGALEEKLSPWMQPIFDNLDYIFHHQDLLKSITGNREKDQAMRKIRPVDYLKEMGVLEIEALTYIRGRSIPNQFMIIDEAQNLTRHEIQTIISRAGEGTKLVFTGDIYQIDNPYVDSMSCGLSFLVEHCKEEAISGSVLLSKCERSALANIASKLAMA